MKNEDKTHKIYNAFLIWNLSAKCNLKCVYCVAEDEIKNNQKKDIINIPLLINTLDKSNKIFNIAFTGGGETFLISNFIDACKEITKKHYISTNTNLTNPQIKKFAEEINPQRVVHVTASAHIKELEKRNLLETYFDNFLLLKNKGFPVLAFAVAYPPLLFEIERYKTLFFKKGIELKFDLFRGEYNGKEYPFAYTKDEMNAFSLNFKKHYWHQKICNAGYNAGVITAGSSDIKACFQVPVSIGNIYHKIKFKKSLIVCPAKFCTCPVAIDSYVYNQALQETTNSTNRFIVYFK